MMQLIKRWNQAKRIVKPVDPERAFDDALDAHAERHAELRKAAAAMLYVRNRMEVELLELRAEIARLHSSIRAMIRSGNETRALALVNERQRLARELELREEELAEIKDDANDATARVVASADERRSLEREKLRSIAAISIARARKRAAELKTREDGPRRALEEVREEIARLDGERNLDRELAGETLVRELGPGFEAGLEGDGARTELARIRASMKTRRCA